MSVVIHITNSDCKWSRSNNSRIDHHHSKSSITISKTNTDRVRSSISGNNIQSMVMIEIAKSYPPWLRTYTSRISHHTSKSSIAMPKKNAHIVRAEISDDDIHSVIVIHITSTNI